MFHFHIEAFEDSTERVKNNMNSRISRRESKSEMNVAMHDD